MQLKEERGLLALWGKQMLAGGMTVATGGNASILRRDTGLMAITPSGMNYQALLPKDMCVFELDTGKQVEGERTPSSETPMHLASYKAREDISAVVHTHPPYITAFSMIREPIPLIHYLVPVVGPYIPVAEYATYGTDAMGPVTVEALEISDAVILPNHGLIFVADSLERAVYKSDICEYIAHSYFAARQMGKAIILDDNELEALRKQFSQYGQR